MDGGVFLAFRCDTRDFIACNSSLINVVSIKVLTMVHDTVTIDLLDFYHILFVNCLILFVN